MVPSYVIGPRPDLPYVDTFSARLSLSDVDKAVLSHCIETYTLPPKTGQNHVTFQDVMRTRGNVHWQTVVHMLALPMERILQGNAPSQAEPAIKRTIVQKYAQDGASGLLGILITAKGVQENVPTPLSPNEWKRLTESDAISFERVVANLTAHLQREIEVQPSRQSTIPIEQKSLSDEDEW